MINKILEIDSQGELRVPAEVLRQLSFTHQYRLEIREGALILKPVREQPFWEVATPEERADRWLTWAEQPRPQGVGLPDEALTRDAIYD
ncbi:hypothetical protein PN498_09780 [Oscillatoria sp. CS-180]|uniref:hypothetical protein n=1 Tax=Oscillatoria sp. CS-180 TaxID=3021720 RepID=UPI00232E41EA|nr:hypothetical protein [Oscillatoria sp. CS-180]MDB9526274.1 hypothetical protein [Oscillatoria sp. CS-180]